MKDRSDVVILVKLAGTNKQKGGGVKHHLQVAGDFCVDCRYAVFEQRATSVIIVNPVAKRLQHSGRVQVR